MTEDTLSQTSTELLETMRSHLYYDRSEGRVHFEASNGDVVSMMRQFGISFLASRR
jgi:hypothetical protein